MFQKELHLNICSKMNFFIISVCHISYHIMFKIKMCFYSFIMEFYDMIFFNSCMKEKNVWVNWDAVEKNVVPYITVYN